MVEFVARNTILSASTESTDRILLTAHTEYFHLVGSDTSARWLVQRVRRPTQQLTVR